VGRLEPGLVERVDSSRIEPLRLDVDRAEADPEGLLRRGARR